MDHIDRWDSLLQYWAFAHGLDWRLIKAQAIQESGNNALAVSECGAQGLLQLMPMTAATLGVTNPFDPDSNLRGGIFYLRDQYRHFPEILDELERWKFALAAYNAGRGNVNRAIQIAKTKNADWQQWQNVAAQLPAVTGRNSGQTIAYVDKIMQHWQELKKS